MAGRLNRDRSTKPAAEPPAGAGKRIGPRAADRVLDLLDVLARQRRKLALADISRLLAIPKASLSDLLKPLMARNYIDRDEDGHFSIGPSTIALARAIVSAGRLADLARPLLEDLARRSGETALIGCLDDDAMVSVYLDAVEADSPIRYTVPVGLRRELHATSVGKVLLAHLPRERLDRYLATHQLQSFTPRTLADPRALRAELDEVCRTGIATTQDERTEGASGVAAPIKDFQGRVVAGLVVAGPTSRMRPARARLVSLVRETAQRISALLDPAVEIAPDTPAPPRRAVARLRT